MKHYNIIAKKDAPSLSLKLPPEILRDLALRAEENGTTLEVEMAIRLARSLERDLAMIERDNQIAFKAFDKINAYLKGK
jgi:hypothetical protein